ncbi:ATP-binding protein [Microcoleus sp. bin38.metabat.b11b12b14.051]|uniref:ATP-binding protein n=1 Tax=Microcoleus sp. bin38.metabat.b11b12b14.051 TaxID=2742709 RepID=UPI0025D83749|nr:ATP-binding protein [Microcoleus sp. bin38.metabat.b11b12b14.051]
MNPVNYVFHEPISAYNCDREPIHIPNAIQPHGILLVFNEADWQILQISDNTESLLGYSPAQLLNQRLTDIFEPESQKTLTQCLAGDFDAVNPLSLKLLNIQKESIFFYGIVHRSPENLLILELEPSERGITYDLFQFYQLTRHTLAKIQSTSDISSLCQLIAGEIRNIIEFDRVMVYRLDVRDGSGEVIAENKRSDLTSYLGLHFPASDIPPPAKELYRLNKLRLITNVNYQPSSLIPPDCPLTNAAPDLTFSILKSVSPCHIEYLQNMKVGASMSISLLKNNQLWGLIACHHGTPKYLPYHTRTICEFIGQVMSLELSNKEEQENLDDKVRLKSLQSDFVASIYRSEDFVAALGQDRERLLGLVNATGAAIISNDLVMSFGKTPSENEINQLLDWVVPQLQDNLYYTDSLPKVYPNATQFKDLACGLIVVSITKIQRNFILWFRPEVIQTVNWGGNPNLQETLDEKGTPRMSPRKSFAKWQEIVQLKSLPWQPRELEGIVELRAAIVGIILKKADELASINEQLQRSNTELDAFAYIASHDLKEPLRGIHNYASFLLADYQNKLDEDGVNKLNTLMQLTKRMENLINGLLHFSRLSRADLIRTNIDLNQLVNNVVDILKISQSDSQLEVEIIQPLPIVKGDRVLIEEIFTNLMSNAIKYNDRPEKRIEIGCIMGKPDWSSIEHPCFYQNLQVFYVKDNGIGIKEKHLDSIFRIFKRLHAPNKYGGGTGAGLTIVKKIVERHGGEIVVESKSKEGTTFYFTLSPPNET